MASRLLKNLWTGVSGNAIVEFTLVLPLFLYMMCGIADMARIFYVETTLQNAVRAGGRYASTGNHQPDPQHAGQTLNRVQSINLITQQAAIGLSTAALNVSSAQGGSGSAGGPGDTVTLTLSSPVRLLTPIVANFFTNGSYTVSVTSSYRNEPFPPSQT